MSPDFRRLWSLEPDVTFLNHGSFGACPTAVLETQSRLRAELESQPVRFLVRELEPRLDASRADLARFLGAATDDVVFVPNATYAVSSVLRSLPLKPGDEIVCTNHEYNACRNAIDFLAAPAGARVVVAEVPFPLESPAQVVEALERALSPRTRLLFIDHVSSQTGLVFPLAEIVAVAARHGVETFVDGAHAPGMVPLDLSTLGAAYYTGNCHKWICAPKGAAFLWVKRSLQNQVRPAVISHGANSSRNDRSRFQVEFGWTGTHDPTAMMCVGEAIRFMGSLLPGGWDELRGRNRALALTARRLLCEALEANAPAPEEMIGSLAAVPLPDATGPASNSPLYESPLQDALLERARIEVPIVPWPKHPLQLIRISAQLYNEPGEYELLAATLRQLL